MRIDLEEREFKFMPVGPEEGWLLKNDVTLRVVTKKTGIWRFDDIEKFSIDEALYCWRFNDTMIYNLIFNDHRQYVFNKRLILYMYVLKTLTAEIDTINTDVCFYYGVLENIKTYLHNKEFEDIGIELLKNLMRDLKKEGDHF